MREPTLSQKARFVILLIELVILCLASWAAFGRFFPAADEKGFWFYTALLGLILGSRLDTPFFAKPADVVLYAAPAAIALALGNRWDRWGDGVQVAYCVAIGFCIITGLLAGLSIVTLGSKSEFWKQMSNATRVLAETLGAPRVIFSVVIAFALFAFHSSSSREIGIIVGAWVLTGVLSPLEGAWRLSRRLRGIFLPNVRFDADGEVVAYQTPGLILVRQFSAGNVGAGDVVAVNDPLGKARLALALDNVGRDEGFLLRTIEIPGAKPSDVIQQQLSALPPNAVIRVVNLDGSTSQDPLVEAKTELTGLVAPDTSVERLFFEVVKEDGLEEGRLVEVKIGEHSVTYQLVGGLTKEEIVQHKNTHGYARAQAQKIGEWDAKSQRFRFVKWMPAPNAPVFLRTATEFQATSSAVGHFPGTDCPVSVKSVHDLVTHNTAILGILGIGKSMLAIELVERMMAAGVKVICVDLTNQYSIELAAYMNAANEAATLAKLQAIGAAGKKKVSQNVEDGGSRADFATAVAGEITTFMNPVNPSRLMVFNPTHFEVWRQDSKPYANNASMASLSPAEITHIISQSALEAATALGITDKARICLVYEEAHSLVPEWNSAVADGDKSASNGSARAILQGRKYGLGCLLVAQRTANVTKTILNQCNTVFAMRTFDDTGKDFLANYIGDDYARSLSSLTERQAVFFGKASSCENPILIRLNDREKFIEVFRGENPPPLIPAATQPPPAAPPVASGDSFSEEEDDIPF